LSHFTVLACVHSPDDLEEALAPYDEERKAEPYREYEEGKPEEHWSLGKEQRSSPVTWTDVAAIYNGKYGDDEGVMHLDEEGRAYLISTRNKNATWDWWTIGGRWSGYFPYSGEHAGDVIMPTGSRDAGIRTAHCDGGPKRALDLAALREEKAEQAIATWRKYHSLVTGLPEALPWSAFRDRIDPDSGYPAERARQEYHDQPRVQAVRGTDFAWTDDPVAQFGIPEALHAERARAHAVPGFATLTLDGRWLAPGTMGWWAVTDATDDSRWNYLEAANAYIDALPGDVWLIAVDCHI
jgi:hypothetical protein